MKAKYETLDDYLDDLDAIKEKVAEKTHGMTAKQIQAYFADSARRLQELTGQQVPVCANIPRTRRVVLHDQLLGCRSALDGRINVRLFIHQPWNGATVCLLPVLLSITCTGIAAQPKAESQPKTADPVKFRTAQGVTYQITNEGLSMIGLGERVIAQGNWSAFNAEPWFKDSGSGRVDTKPLREKSMAVLGPNQARVRQVKGDLTCVTDYTLQGEDLLISARVENNHPDESLNVVGFSGLEFQFQRPPTGLMMVQHISYFLAHGVGLCHPGHWAKIGGSYALDGSIGIGLSPWKTGWNRTLFLWDYADWNPDQRENLPRRRLIYFVVAPVPARGARTFDMKMRVSPSQDWKHLLEPYRQHFQQTFGPVRYKSDDRWIATDYLNHSQQAIAPDNPYGFHGGARRIDRPEGVKEFCDRLIPALQQANGQGVIVWGQGGDDPRGAMYRPDFDVLPPEVEANWTTLAQRFRKAGLKIGVATRPSDMAVRQDWKSDQVISINADDRGHQAMLGKRFQNMLQKGCTLFYLDSFGSDLEHVKLMRVLREKLGPDALTFAEHQCDAIFPYSGGYSETTFQAAKPGQKAGYRIWSGLENWEIYQWLVPGSSSQARLYQVEGPIPRGFESVDEFFYRHRVTPLLPVSDLTRAAALRTIQARYLDSSGRWGR